MSGGGAGPSPGGLQQLDDERARQAELRKQAELARFGRGRPLASVVGDEFFHASTLLGGRNRTGNPVGNGFSTGQGGA